MRFLPAMILMALSACAASRVQPGATAHLVAGVPFFPQEPRLCGPAALASLVGFFGHSVSPEQVAAEIYEPGASGTTTVAMVAYAASHQLPMQAIRSTMNDLRAEIDAGRPLVVLHGRSFPYRDYHFVIITGYDRLRNEVYGYSGRNRAAGWTALDFERRWARAGNWALVWVDDAGSAGSAPGSGARDDDQTHARQRE